MASIAALGFSIISRFNDRGVNEAQRALARLRGEMALFNRDLDRMSAPLATMTRGMEGWQIALAAISPVLVPLSGQILSVSGAIVTMATSAGVAGGAWALALKGAVGRIKDTNTGVLGLAQNLSKQKAILAEMTPGTDHYSKQLDKVKKAQDMYNHALADATPAQKTFIQSFEKMNESWQRFITNTQGDTLGVASKAMDAIAVAIGKLEPLVHAVTPAVQHIVDLFSAWVNVKMDGWVSFFSDHGPKAINAFVDISRNLGSVFGSMLKAFAGDADHLGVVLVNMSARLKSWADGGGFQKFLEYAHQNAPMVKDLLEQLGKATWNLIKILDEFNPGATKLLTDFFRFIANLDPSGVQAMANSFLLLKSPIGFLIANCPPLRDLLIEIVSHMDSTVVYSFAAAWVALKVAMAVGNFSSIGSLLLSLMSPMGLVIATVAALGVVVYLMVTRWHEFADYMSSSFMDAVHAVWSGLQTFWGWITTAFSTVWSGIQTAWSAVWSGLKTAASTVWSALQTAWSAFTGGLSTAWSAVSGALSTAWSTVWSGIQTAASAVWSGLQTAWSAVTSALSTAWSAVSGALSTAWNATWSGLQTAAQAVWSALQTAWSAVTNALSTAWSAVSGALSAAWSATWNGLQTAAQAVWTALQTAWNTVVNALSTAWSAVSGALSAAWSATWNGLQTAAQAVWTALQTAWSAVTNALSTAWSAVSGALSSAWSATWNGIQTAAQAVWTALQTAWQAVVNAISTAWSAVSGAIQSAWQATWSAIQTAAQAVWSALQTAWQAFTNALSTAWNTVSAALRTAWDTVWNALKTAAQAVWTAMQTAWQAVLTAVQTAWTTVSAALTTAWNAFWNAVKTAAQAIWTAMQTAWQAFLTAVQTVWTTVSNALKAAWQAVWTSIQTAANTVWNALKSAWSTFLSAVQTAWTTASNALKAAWSAVWNAVKTAAETVWNALKSTWNTITNAIGDIWDKAGAALKKAWQEVWDTLKRTASNVWNDIKDAVEKGINALLTPINFLIKGFNSIADAVHLDIKIPEIHVNFAAGGMVGDMPHFAAGGTVNFSSGGGVLNGYAPGRDTVPAVLSRGEGVLVPEAVRGLGGSNFVHWANSHFSNGRGGKRVSAPMGRRQRARGAGMGGMRAWHVGAQGWGFAGGGVAGGLGEVMARSGGNLFAIGGLPSEIPAPDPNNPGQTSGTVGQTPGKNPGGDGSVGVPGLSDVIGKIPGGDILSSIMGLNGGVASMVLGFIGKEALDKALLPLIDKITGNFGAVGNILAGVAKAIGHGLLDWLIKQDSDKKKEYESMAVAGAKSVQAWADLARQAMIMGGLDPAQLPAFLQRMQIESGGNPNAINNWDINARNGIPSQGLMQIIPPNFTKYHVAGTSNNILDPLANMAAAAAYIKAVYGGRVPTGAAYALGTPGANSGVGLVGEKGPELINFKGGERVTPTGDTMSILANMAAQQGMDSVTQALAPVTPQVPANTMPQQADLMSPMLSQLQAKPPQGDGWFGDIIAAAIHMADVVKKAWDGTVQAGSSALPSITDVTDMVSSKTGKDIPTNLAAMSDSSTKNWAVMSTTAQTNWASMRDGVFTPAETHQGTTMPATATTMDTSNTTAWTSMAATSTAQWALMRDTTFAESELHQGTTMPTMATTMQTASNTAWTDMQTQSAAQYTTMQDNTILPLEDHMGVQVPGAATTMNTSVTDMVTQMVTNTNDQLDQAIAKIQEFIQAAQAATEAANQLVQAAQAAAAASAAASAAAASGGGGGGGGSGPVAGNTSGVEQWRSMALQAMGMAGLDTSQIDKFLALMQAESGGNPNAINNWDSNAAAGTPSIGLMQVIQPTFDAYHVAGTSSNIYDPLANMAASAAYIVARYGGNVPGSPYAHGTTYAKRGWHMTGERGPELISSPGYRWFNGGEKVMSNSKLRRWMGNNGPGGSGYTPDFSTSWHASNAPGYLRHQGDLSRPDGNSDNGPLHVEIPVTINGNADAEAVVRGINAEVLPQLNILLKKHR